MSNHSASYSGAKTYPRRSSLKNWKAGVLGWLPVFIGVAIWVASLFGADAQDSLEGFGIFAAIAVSVVAHELAHFIVGRLLGRKPWCLRIGHGEIVFDKEFESFRLLLLSLPYSGAVYPSVKGSRREQFAAILAAPMTNAALLLISIFFVTSSNDASRFTAFPMQMAIANGYLLMFSIVPFYSKRGQANDAMLLLHLLRDTPLKTPLNKSTHDNLTPSWRWLVKHHSAEELLKQFRGPLERPEISPENRQIYLDTFATCVLMFGANQFLEEADRYSEELLRSKPDELSYKGTRGSVLIEKGDLTDGIAMLEEVMNGATDPNDLTISASFLALAYHKQGQRAEALRWLATSRQIDPDCVSMRRIAKLITSESATQPL